MTFQPPELWENKHCSSHQVFSILLSQPQQIKKAREFQKNTYFFIDDYTKALACVNHNKLENP